jgi:predicted outer membrane repeat protein
MPQTSPGSRGPTRLVRPRRGLVALLVGLALSLSGLTRGQATTTWPVCTSGCEYRSIEAAMASPTTLDGDTLALASRLYTESGITVDKSLTLRGEAAATTIVQAAASRGLASDRVFTIASGVTVTLQDLTIRYGHAADHGGGIGNYGTLTLINSTVQANTATYYGGGLYTTGTLILINSTVRSNRAGSGGGGLYNTGLLTLTNSTVRSNRAGSGGGLSNWGTLSLTNSTISSNRAGSGGGLLNWGRLTLTTSLMANTQGGENCRSDYGSIRSYGYNLDSDGSCRLTAPTDQPGVDPLLGPLQDNGGPTFTHALLPGSPAIDAIPLGINGCGTTLTSDQRGQARPQPAEGPCDLGAYEVAVGE